IACGYRFSSQYGIIIKFDINGGQQWFQTYPTGSLKSLTSIEELPNGGYIVSGSNKDSSIDTNRALLMRIDQLGNTIWEKKYKVFNKPASGHFVKKLPNGFFLAGRTTDTANVVENERIYFLRTDTSGNITFTKLFTYYKKDFIAAAQYINDNRFIFSSRSYSQIIPGDTAYNKVMIADTMGNILISRNFLSPVFNEFNSILVAQNRD